MKQANTPQQAKATSTQPASKEWPNDFNFSASAAEQKEMIISNKNRSVRVTPPLTCSEYDF